MGGRIATDLVVRAPEPFHSVLVGGMGVYTIVRTPEEIAAVAAALETDDPSSISDAAARLYRQVAELGVDDTETLNDLKALAACWITFAPQRDQVDVAALERVRVPMLAFSGDKDAALSAAQRLAEIVPAAEFVVLAGEDHLDAWRVAACKTPSRSP